VESYYIIVLVTTANKAEAEKIANTLLQEKLIACANIINPVTSFFRWKDKIDCSEECLVVMKSRMDKFGCLANRVKELHSYEVPEILALPVVAGSEEYLGWVAEALK
jgi:periplasmic divalent cation tolerance protein